MKKKVLIVIGIPNFDYANEKSAVATYLNEIKIAFNTNGHDADFPSVNLDSSNKVSVNSNKDYKFYIKKLLKKWNWFYQSLSFRQFFKQQENIFENLQIPKKYDLIIEFYTVGSLVGVTLAKQNKAKLSVIFDSPVDEQFLEMYNTKSIYWNKIQRNERLTFEQADKIMTYSPACSDFVTKKFRLKGETSILPCVINKKSIKNNPIKGTFNIGFIGSFLSWHKVSNLVDAFKVVLEKIPEAKLQLIGFGVEWEAVKNKVKVLNLQNNVEMPGFVNELELLEYKKCFSVAVMPGSNWYGSPLKLFEYAQCGIPFIAPKSKTVLSIFEENTHCLYIDKKDEVSSLVNQILKLYNNQKLLKEIGNNSMLLYEKKYASNIYSKLLVSSLLPL